ncbi:MAG: DUF3551 domain-containing protein [Pseudomonadota bacterium]
MRLLVAVMAMFGVLVLAPVAAEAKEYRWCAFTKKGTRICAYDKFSKCMNAPGRATCSRNPRYSNAR